MRLGVLATHPIQNHAPIFRELARRCDLTVYFAHRQTSQGHAQAGFGVPFEWDVDLLSGYSCSFLENHSRHPATNKFFGCDTPDIEAAIDRGRFSAFLTTGWNVKSYWQAVNACRRRRVPVIVRGDSQLADQRVLPVRLAKRIAYPWLLRLFDAFCYVGRRNHDYLRHYGLPEERLFFSPHCVDNDFFAGKAEAWCRPHDTMAVKTVLFAGKLVAAKRPLDVIRALTLAAGPEFRAEVVFAGAGELGDSLKQEAARGGLPATFLGFQNQSRMPAIYAGADVLVLPSERGETWGLVVNEAMACGVPAVVSTAVGCGPDLIQPGVTGAVFPVGDVPALAAAIRSTLALDRPAVCRHLSKKMNEYSPERAVQGIMAAATAMQLR